MRPAKLTALFVLRTICLGFVATGSAFAADDAAPTEKFSKPAEWKAGEWVSLFDGKTLQGWKATKFGGEGEVAVKKGEIHLDFGSSLTGITCTRDLPKVNYEVELMAMKTDGYDFFCALTFPVVESHCSFVCGGWGGTVVGLSSVDHYDASENETSKFIDFKAKKWYKIRARVTEKAIRTWIDDKPIVNLNTQNRKIDIRIEMDLCRPLGIAAWETSSALKDIRIRKLTAEEIKQDAPKPEE
jgi:hypothetical protein